MLNSRPCWQGCQDEIRALTGRMETLEFLIARDGGGATAGASSELKRLDNAITRNYQRLMALETHLGLEPTDASLPWRAGSGNAEKCR